MDKPIVDIKLQFACNEDWETMPLAEAGRHCDKCNHKVNDLSDKSDADLRVVKADNPSGFCGRFKLSQTIYNKAAAALILSSGIGLSAQGQTPQRVAGKDKTQARPDKISTAQPVLTEKKDTVEHFLLGVIAEPMPLYPGREDSLMKFIANNIEYPQEVSFDGKVYIQFVVDTAGNVNNPIILRGAPPPQIEREILRVVNLLKFEPYHNSYSKKGITYVVPVMFRRREE
jgi:protein TonB